MSLLEEWRGCVELELPDAIELRHRLHADPRVTGSEQDTAVVLVDAIGYGDVTPVARTGRLVRLSGTPSVPAVALRTEMDALPVVERTNVAWRSANGAMHACGHDVHMAALVAVARAARGLALPVPLLALLQPREEGSDSGARDIVDEAGLTTVGDVVAAHVQPQLTAGIIAVTGGSVNAGTDEFTIRVTGGGGHSGYPHAVDDSVLALSAIVVALQQIAAGRIDPVVGAVCMVNQLRAGSAPNVVPDIAIGGGTVRTMRAEDRVTAHTAIEQIVRHTAASYGCDATVEFAICELPLVNDALLAAATVPLLHQLGHPTASEFRSFGSDDFAFYSDHARSLMMFVGTGRSTGGLHDATYLPEDSYVALVADALLAGYCAAAALR
jgi:amidohydrolase